MLWGKRLLEDADNALDAILTGRGGRGVQQRAEVDDFLADLLAYPIWTEEQRQRLAEQIDGALIPWLAARLRWTPAGIDKYGLRAYVAQLAMVLAVAARLPAPRSAYRLAEEQPYWDRQFAALRWPGDLDLRQSYDLALIQHQADHRFAPRWFAACEHAAWFSPYWETSLTTGLLGLRKLPHAPGSQPERTVAAGLTHFAVAALQRGMGENTVALTFRRRAQALTVFYPRGREGHWQGIWADVLGNLSANQRAILEKWLHESVPGGWSKSTSSIRPKTAVRPTRAEMDKRLKAVRQADRLDQNMWAKVRDLVERYWADADVTGDGYFAVGAVCNFGSHLMRLRPGHHALQSLHAWAVRALDVEPYNAHPWGLWAKVLAALGRQQDSLAVRWETARRFPDNPVIRTELADALAGAEQPLVAERLLRQSIADFPDNAWCRSMLAELLRDTDRVEEAETLLRQSTADFPDDEVPRNMLAELLCKTTGREREAEELLNETMKTFPEDLVCRNMLAYLLYRQGRYAEAERPFREAEALDPNNPYVRDLAVRLGFSIPAAGDSSELELPPPHFHLRPDRWGQTLEPAGMSGEGESVGPWPDFFMPHYGRPNLRKQESNQEDSHAVASTATDVALPHCEQAATTAATVPTAPEAILPSAAEVLEHYLAQLVERLPWLERYFADGAPSVTETDDGSELALVVEYRRSPQPEIALANKLNLAAKLRPGAYSVQMLHAWLQHREKRDWSRALADLAKAFPEQRLHDLLRYPDLSVVERKKVDAFQEKSKQNNTAPARQQKSRLASVYPQLFGGAEPPHPSQALQRLVEDIAFACADESVPSVPT